MYLIVQIALGVLLGAALIFYWRAVVFLIALLVMFALLAVFIAVAVLFLPDFIINSAEFIEKSVDQNGALRRTFGAIGFAMNLFLSGMLLILIGHFLGAPFQLRYQRCGFQKWLVNVFQCITGFTILGLLISITLLLVVLLTNGEITYPLWGIVLSILLLLSFSVIVPAVSSRARTGLKSDNLDS